MLRQSFPQDFFKFKNTNSNDNCNVIDRSLLLDIVHENHLLYYMEKRDRPNNLIRLLVELHKLGATREQLSTAYQKALLDVESIRVTDTTKKINENNWKEFLGISSYYKDYLLFFDIQLQTIGVEETLNKYFYSIEHSIGSQLQPIVQLAFGIENDLPEIISQALAYYASTYLDVSNLLEDCQKGSAYNITSTTSQQCDHELVNKILFDLVHADQRFGGKIEGEYNTLQSSIKLLLKSQPELLKTYMMMWSMNSYCATDKLDMLIYTAMTLVKVSSRQSADNGPVELDWFLAGGQLLESALAIKYMMRSTDHYQHLETWVNIQFLSTLCTFVVQGRPMNKTKTNNVNTNIQDILSHAADDAKLVLTISSITKVKELYPQYGSLCLDVLQLLSQFSVNGTWIKTGLGWLN